MSSKRPGTSLLWPIILILLTAGCGGRSSPAVPATEVAVAETATLRPSDTPAPSPTSTATATFTPTPSDTATPTSTTTSTPTPSPTQTPSPTETATPTSSPTALPTLPPSPPPTSPPPSETPATATYATWHGIPIIPGAVNGYEDEGGRYFYLVAAGGDVVRKFYAEDIAPLGWTVTQATGDANFGGLLIAKAGCVATIIYENGQDGTAVMLVGGC